MWVLLKASDLDTSNEYPQHMFLLWNNENSNSNAPLFLGYMGLDVIKPVFGFANNKSADQPAHMRSLISAFVIH